VYICSVSTLAVQMSKDSIHTLVYGYDLTHKVACMIPARILLILVSRGRHHGVNSGGGESRRYKAMLQSSLSTNCLPYCHRSQELNDMIKELDSDNQP